MPAAPCVLLPVLGYPTYGGGSSSSSRPQAERTGALFRAWRCRPRSSLAGAVLGRLSIAVASAAATPPSVRKQSDRRRVTACLGSRRNGMVSDAGLRTQVLRGGRAVLLVRFWRDYVAFSLHPHPRTNNKSSFRFPLRADKRGRNPPVIRKWGHATPTVLFKRTWLGQPLTQLLCYQSQTTVLRRQKKTVTAIAFPTFINRKQ